LVKKLLVHEDVEEDEWKTVVEAKKMGQGSLMPKGFEKVNVEDVVLVSDCSDRGKNVMRDYGGVCGLLFFAMNIQEMMKDSEVGVRVEGKEVEEGGEEGEGWKGEEEEEEGGEQKGEWYCKKKEEDEGMMFMVRGKEELGSKKKKMMEGAVIREEEKVIKKFLGEHERLRYAFGPVECKVAMKNELLCKLLVHEAVKDSLLKKVVGAKMNNENMPVEVNVEEIFVIGKSGSQSGLIDSILSNYLGVVGQLYFDIDMNDLMPQEYVSDVPQVQKKEVKNVSVNEKGRIKYTDKVFVPRWCTTEDSLGEVQLPN